ncbi:MAG: HNH endonuclease, partial [Actinomycetota bacterium]|nr:HNH endonuclease [Actinomycetota bacterium]
PVLGRSGARDRAGVRAHGRDGAPLEVGRTSYRIPKAMRQWLRLRDGKCPFPGCSNHSLDNDADHLLSWAHGGTTGISNLGQPCPLCRYRHKGHYADVRIMPMLTVEPLSLLVSGWMLSA